VRLEISQFGGMAPIIDPTALPDKFSTFAKNVRLDRGVLAPAALELEAVGDYPDGSLSGKAVKAVAKMLGSDTRFAFSHADAANAFVSPVSPADTWGRVYFMDSAGPSFTTTDQYSPGGLVVNPVSYRLGIETPGAPPVTGTVEIEHEYEEGAPDDGGYAEGIEIKPDYVTVAYAFSYVDKYGHEGGLSRASEVVRIAYDRTFEVAVSDLRGSVGGRHNFLGGKKRIYRATFDGSSSVWQFLTDVPYANDSFGDDIPVGEEGEVAISGDWLPAPEDLENLCLVASSFAAGTLGHYVCYSELKLPHAWPTELQFPVKYTPVGLMPLLNGLLVVTTGRPYWAEGTDPNSAIPRELPINAPCLSTDSLVDMGDYAMYVSLDGLVAARPGQAEIVTKTVLDRAEMETLVDEDCTAFAFDGRYVFSTKDGRWMGFVPQEGLVEYDFGYAPRNFRAVSFNVRDNRHYFCFNDGTVRAIEVGGTASGVEWRSKLWRTSPESFSAIRVEADTYPVEVVVRCQYLGEEWQESPAFGVTGPHVQRLPVMTGGLWQVVVKPPSEGRVYRLILGQSGQETR
jgi:hypothetical protein